jgi:phosphopantetheinyl transferase
MFIKKVSLKRFRKMGILYTRDVDGPAILGAWEIKENTAELLSGLHLSQPEMELYLTFRTETRRLQWLAYRRLLKELTGPGNYTIHYDEAGKPFLSGLSRHISVTHTGSFAGVILSTKARVGIDMEEVRPRIEKVKEKFLSEDEISSIPEHLNLDYLTLGWCAKEALYKMYGYRSMDFRDNMKLDLPQNPEEGSFKGRVMLHGKETLYKLHYERHGNLFTVWVADSPANEIRQ